MSSKRTGAPSNSQMYVIDASSLIEGRNILYPPRVFPSLWPQIGRQIVQHNVYIPQQVIAEVKKKIDLASRWVNMVARGQFHPNAQQRGETSRHFGELATKYPRMLRSGRGNASADLYVIAWAKSLDATVITQENPAGSNKIPAVSRGENITCINISEFIVAQGWIFR